MSACSEKKGQQKIHTWAKANTDKKTKNNGELGNKDLGFMIGCSVTQTQTQRESESEVLRHGLLLHLRASL